jgi:hypothetical protein
MDLVTLPQSLFIFYGALVLVGCWLEGPIPASLAFAALNDCSSLY